MTYNEHLINKRDTFYNECLSKGICSTAPSLNFLHEVLIYYLRDLSFYLLKLNKLGIKNEKIKENILDIISSIIVETEYNNEYFLRILSTLYSDFVQAKDLYTSVCAKNNLKADFIKSTLKSPQKLTFAGIIRIGQNIFNRKLKRLTEEQKHLSEIAINIMKSICIHLIELKELEINDEEGYTLLLELFSIPIEDLSKNIEKIAKYDHSLLMKLNQTREERYGQIEPTEISKTTRPNKAILVAGTNLRELELLLEATKDKNIDIYTNGHMLMAHAFPKFKSYPHLVGHWGQNTETLLFDFAEFPGAILITKHSMQKIENLYRSRIFTTDVIAPKGVCTIRNNDFEPLIKSAMEAKGFSKSVEKPSIKTNLDEKLIIEKIKQVAEKIEQKEIKYFLAIGVSNHTKIQKDYFERFLALLPEDCFTISFSYTNKKKNILLIESDYGFPILYKTLELLAEKQLLKDLKPAVLFTRCEPHTISNVLYLKFLGINNIYFTDCPPTLINPSLISFMRKFFDIKNYTNPENDLKEILT